MNVEGSNSRPSEIGLAHELVHADQGVEGEMNMNLTPVDDPDGSGKKLRVDEVNARQRENEIREEHGLPARKIYKWDKKEEE